MTTFSLACLVPVIAIGYWAWSEKDGGVLFLVVIGGPLYLSIGCGFGYAALKLMKLDWVLATIQSLAPGLIIALLVTWLVNRTLTRYNRVAHPAFAWTIGALAGLMLRFG